MRCPGLGQPSVYTGKWYLRTLQSVKFSTLLATDQGNSNYLIPRPPPAHILITCSMHASTASDQSTAHHISLQVAVLVHHKVKKTATLQLFFSAGKFKFKFYLKSLR